MGGSGNWNGCLGGDHMEFTPEEDSRPALLLAAPTPGYNLLFLHLPSVL